MNRIRKERHVVERWLDKRSRIIGKHPLILMAEFKGVRSNILPDLQDIVRSHYVDPQTTAARIKSLGAPKTAQLLRDHMPSTKRARSGDLGEILATELAEQQLQYRIPIRRLRWKDGRDMALRGDDLVGAMHKEGKLMFLKGESKSRANLTSAVLDEAGDALDRNRGRPTRHSVIFVADRLREQEKDNLAQEFEEAVLNGFQGISIDHFLFVLCGGCPNSLLQFHLKSNKNNRCIRHTIGVRIRDHAKFVKQVFEE